MLHIGVVALRRPLLLGGRKPLKIGIAGATERLGRAVVEVFKAIGQQSDIVALVRDPNRAKDLGVPIRLCDYSRPDTLVRAFSGLDRALFIPSNNTSGSAVQHIAAIQAAELAGVGLLVYASLLHADQWPPACADGYQAAERKLNGSWISSVILRNGCCIEDYTECVGSLLASGVLHSCFGDGRISWASRRDYALAAVAVLTGSGHRRKVYELAGDAANSLRDFVAEVSRQTGRSLRYDIVSESDQIEALQKAGWSEPCTMAQALFSEARAVAANVLFDDSHTLSRIIEKPTTTLELAVAEALQRLGADQTEHHK